MCLQRFSVRILLLATALLPLAACSEVLGVEDGPLKVEILGPAYTYAVESTYGEESEFECEYQFTVRVSGAKKWVTRAQWSSLRTVTYEPGTKKVIRAVGIPYQEVRWRLNVFSFSGEDQPFSYRVSADRAPFDWTVDLGYYRTDTGEQSVESFSGRCLNPAQG